MYATARFDLGLDDETFWRSTPRLLDALTRRASDRRRDEWRRHALVAAVVANANRDPKRKPRPYRPDDFVRDRPKKQTPQQQLAMVEQMNRMLGGRDLRGAGA